MFRFDAPVKTHKYFTQFTRFYGLILWFILVLTRSHYHTRFNATILFEKTRFIVFNITRTFSEIWTRYFIIFSGILYVKSRFRIPTVFKRKKIIWNTVFLLSFLLNNLFMLSNASIHFFNKYIHKIKSIIKSFECEKKKLSIFYLFF